MTPGALGTAIYVSYATPTLDLTWLPDSAPVVIVHNDDSLERASLGGRAVCHVAANANIGFGAAVNLALSHVTTERAVLCNPDVHLAPGHWDLLVDAGPDDVVTLPLVDATGGPTSVTSRYPSPLSHVLSGFRLGRFAPRGGRTRDLVSRALGAWGAAHRESLQAPSGVWPLRERWVSGGVMSADTARLRALGGFDARFFMYYEDVDLCGRFAARFPASRAVVPVTTPGIHRVGGSASSDRRERSHIERRRRDSAVLYAHDRPGLMWRASERILRGRAAVAA